MTVKFDDLQNNLIEDIKALKNIQDPKERLPLMKKIAHKAEDLNELVIFALISETDNFFGNVTIQLNRKISFGLDAPAAVAFKGTYFDLMINPILLYGNYKLPEIKAILIHETYHIICKHLPRTLPLFDVYPQLILNLGTDCAINQFIPNIPDGCVTIESLQKDWKVKRQLEREREAEYYIEGLLEEYKNNKDFQDQINNQSGQGQKKQQQQGGGSGGGNGTREDGSSPKPGDADYDGETGAYKGEEDYASGHDAWKMSDTDQNMETADDVVRNMLNEAAAKSRGRIPSNVQEVIKKLNEKPILNWRQMLRKYVGQLAKPYKKTITRKSRRMPERADLRGKLNDHVSEIVVAIDTSGSMDDRTISYCMQEVFEIIKHQEAKDTIIECDCRINRVYTAKKASEVKPDIQGRGGTSFDPVFQWLRDNNKRNVVLVYFTDGYGEYALSQRPICYRCLWVLTGRATELSLREPYGEVRELRLDEKWNKR